MSILLGWLFGLPGILSGVLLSLVVVIKGWKPWFLFSRYLHTPFRHYVGMYARHLAALAVALALFIPLVRLVDMNPADSWLKFAFCAVMVAASFTILLGGSLYLFDRGMRDFAARALHVMKLKH
jgi:glycopeptide antibiotics resistance protein